MLEGPRPTGTGTGEDAGGQPREVQSVPEFGPSMAQSSAAGGGREVWGGPAEMSFLDGDILTQDWFGEDFDFSQWPEITGPRLDGGWTMDMS